MRHEKGQKLSITVLDKGTGTNLVKEVLFQPEALEFLEQSQELVNLASASQHKIDVLWIVRLTVIFGSQTDGIPFIVELKICTEVLLGCSYIYKYM